VVLLAGAGIDLLVGTANIRLSPYLVQLSLGTDLLVETAGLRVDGSQINLDIGVGVSLDVGIANIVLTGSQINLSLGVDADVGTGLIHLYPQEMPLEVGAEVAVRVDTGEIILSPQYLRLSAGNEPVYIWHAPDRQCVPRVSSRNVIVLQPGEDVWVAFDFNDVIDNNDSEIASVNYIEDGGTGVYAGQNFIEEGQVRFRLNVPPTMQEQDITIEVAIIDSKNNRHICDGLLRIREGLG
jgi:hypothetical protein